MHLNRRSLVVASFVAVFVLSSACKSDPPQDSSPEPQPLGDELLLMQPTCGNIGTFVLLSQKNGLQSGGSTASFTGGGEVMGRRSDKDAEYRTTLAVNVPPGSVTGPVRWLFPPGNTVPPIEFGTFTIPCSPDAGPQDGGSDAPPSEASTCTPNGTCDTGEGCECADCATKEQCGAGCTAITLGTYAPASFGSNEGKLSAFGGAAQDNIQAFWKTGTVVGTQTLTTPANQSEVGGTKTVIQAVADNFSLFYVQTSGTVEITKTSPPTGIFRNVVFRRRINGAGGAVSADPAADCLYMANGAFPHL